MASHRSKHKGIGSMPVGRKWGNMQVVFKSETDGRVRRRAIRAGFEMGVGYAESALNYLLREGEICREQVTART